MSTLHLSLVGLGLRIATTLIVVVNTLLLARLLGPAAFGEYVLFFRLVSILAAFADFGLPQSVNAYYGRHWKWRRSIHRVVIAVVPLLWLVVALVGAFTLWITGDLLIPHLMPVLVFTAFGVLPLSMYANLWNGMMIGAGRIWRVNLLQLVMCILSLLLTIIFLLLLSGGLVSAALIYVFVMVVQFIVMLVMAFQLSTDEETVAVPAALSREMLNFGIRGYVGSLSYLLWTRLPVFILNITHGPSAVGIFSLGQQVVEKLLLPVQSVRDVIYQKMSVLPQSIAAPALNRYLRLTGWGMALVSVVGALVARVLVLTLLGQQYIESVEVARILLAGAVLVAFSLLLDTFFVNHLHRPGLVSILAWCRLFIGLVCAAIFIPSYGAEGAAGAIVLTQIVGTAVYIGLYMQMTRTTVRDLLLVRIDDLVLLRNQILELTKFKVHRSSAAAASPNVQPGR